MPDGHSSQADYPGASPYPDYRPSPAPGHSQPSVSADHAGLPAGYGQAAYTGQYPSPTYPGGLTYPGNYPAYPGGYPAMGTVPYPYPYPGGYHRFGMLPLPPEVAPLPGANPMEAFTRFFRRYTQFRGYASRSEYWWVTGINIFLGTVAIMLFIILDQLSAPEYEGAETAQGVILITLMLYGVATFLPHLALSVRRLHDTGNSGLLMILEFIPGVNYFSWIIIMVLCIQPSHPERYRPEWS